MAPKRGASFGRNRKARATPTLAKTFPASIL